MKKMNGKHSDKDEADRYKARHTVKGALKDIGSKAIKAPGLLIKDIKREISGQGSDTRARHKMMENVIRGKLSITPKADKESAAKSNRKKK